MLLYVSALQGHFQATLYKYSNSLYFNYIVFLRHAVHVPSCLLISWNCSYFYVIVGVFFRCAYQALPCVPFLSLYTTYIGNTVYLYFRGQMFLGDTRNDKYGGM
jgi:hypothetical protein